MEEIYKENAKIVYHFIYSLCHDSVLAEELTQETFMRAFQSIERFDGSCKFSTWLCQIAKHIYYQYLAKHKKEIPKEETGDTVFNEITPERQVVARIELLDVLKKMQKLPEKVREVIYLRIAADLSFREIGEILGKSENWARVNYYRGKEKLLSELQKERRDLDG